MNTIMKQTAVDRRKVGDFFIKSLKCNTITWAVSNYSRILKQSFLNLVMFNLRLLQKCSFYQK